jgi:hypothetical protein
VHENDNGYHLENRRSRVGSDQRSSLPAGGGGEERRPGGGGVAMVHHES